MRLRIGRILLLERRERHRRQSLNNFYEIHVGAITSSRGEDTYLSANEGKTSLTGSTSIDRAERGKASNQPADRPSVTGMRIVVRGYNVPRPNAARTDTHWDCPEIQNTIQNSSAARPSGDAHVRMHVRTDRGYHAYTRACRRPACIMHRIARRSPERRAIPRPCARWGAECLPQRGRRAWTCTTCDAGRANPIERRGVAHVPCP